MPGTETAGRYHAETTLPARAPVRNRHRESRKTPGFQRLHRRTRRHPDWLAEDAVSSEPVSTIEFFESRRLRRKPGGQKTKTTPGVKPAENPMHHRNAAPSKPWRAS